MDSFVMKENLPSRELGLFKKVRKCYEQKQYKNGLKFTKQILSNPKFSDHGETLAMKGLFLNCLGKKDEAYENVKKGLKKDLTSFICWHTYGLLQRSDYKYDEAIKCYRKALQSNQNNIQIWRDLSALQIQMRDLEGFCESRYQLFKLRASQRTSWIGFALANHLVKEFKLAASILEEFRRINTNTKTPVIDYENSEILLYQISLYIEEEDYAKALKCSNDHHDEICDKVSLYEYQADILIKLNKFYEAVNIIKEKLLNRNPDNKLYYQMLETALNVKDNEKKRHKIYLEYQKNFPCSILPFRLPLNFLTGEDFVKNLDMYMRKSLRKGRPALFKDLKSLYKNEKNHLIIQNLLESYHTNLLQNLSFDSDPSTKCSEDLTTIVWLDYYLAQHYCHLKDYKKALSIIDKSILQTPTLIELYVFKAKIYKRIGEINEAVECINEAQSLDTADRYLNAKCVKYMLRANMINEAEKMSSKFTREGLPANEDLNEMQCMWYQTEVAYAYFRLNNYGEALKKCYEINRHFTEMNEDQFDFHSYSMRKVTLRAYVDLLRLIDGLKSHPFYFNAAKLAIKIYLKLFDNPITDQQDSNTQTSNDELKINGKKSRKEKKNKESDKETVTKPKEDKNKEKVTSNSNIYSNLHCEKLVAKDLERPENALEEAERFLKPLLLFASDRIETHLLSFEVYHRRNKFLLMLKSLKKAVKLDSENKKLNDQLKLFSSLVNEKKEGLHDYVQKVITIELKKIEDLKLSFITQKMNSITQEFV